MRIRNSTAHHTLKICHADTEISLQKDKSTMEIGGGLEEIQVHQPSDSDLKLSLTKKVGTSAGGRSDWRPDDGTGDDDEPALMTDGGDPTGGNRTGRGRRHAVEIANSTGNELRLRIERTIPNNKALRIVGPPGLFDVTEDHGGICVTLRSLDR